MTFSKTAGGLLLGAALLTAACQSKTAEAPGAAVAEMTDEQKTIYAFGAAVGQQVAQQTNQLRLSPEELKVFQAGLSDSVNGKEPAVKIEEYAEKFQTLAEGRIAAGAAEAQEQAASFLAAAEQEPGAVKTDSGLVIRTLTPGEGASPKATDTVKVHYHGTLTDGKVFDSSVDRGEPAEFALNRVIPCWTEGVQRMKVGEKAKLVCPAALAYGDRGAGADILPGATLVFEVDLLEIKAD